MGAHSFDKDLVTFAKRGKKSLLAFAYRGRFGLDSEGPFDDDFALKFAKFATYVMSKKDASLIPAVDEG